jgi:hypothetical protein
LDGLKFNYFVVEMFAVIYSPPKFFGGDEYYTLAGKITDG